MRERARHTNGILTLLVISIAINYLDRGALSVSAPLLVRDLGLSSGQMGLIFSAFFWSYSTFQLVAGSLVDRYSVRRVYAAGFFLWSAATAAVGFVYSLPALLIARVLLGVGESVAYPACSRVLARDFPEHKRGFANALIDAGSKIGPGLSTLTGGLMVDRFGWRALFVSVGLASLVWLLPWFLWTRGGSSESHQTTATGPGWGQLITKRQVWGTSLGMFALGYVWYFLLSWLPSYLVRERGLSMSEMAVFGSIPFWAMAGSSLICGWSSDRSIRAGGKPERVRMLYVTGGLLLCGVTLLPAALIRNTTSSLVLMTTACVFLGLFTSNVWAVTQTLAGPEAAGKWTGMQNAIGNLGGVLSPLVTGWIVDATGSFLLAFVGAAVILVMGAAAYLFIVRTVRPVIWADAIAKPTEAPSVI